MAPKAPRKRNFFVSYTRNDRAWASWIAWVLEAGGYTTTIQEWDFPPGSDFVQEMRQALEQCQRFIAVLTPDYLKSDYAAAEWHEAFRRDPIGMHRSLLPVRVGECDPEALLGARVYVDLVGLPEDSARQRLLETARAKRRKPKQQPPHPLTALPNYPGRVEPSSGTTSPGEILHHLQGMIDRRADGDFLVHTLYGLKSSPSLNPEPSSFQTVYYLWADARGSDISAKIASAPPGDGGDSYFEVRFTNAPRTNASNIAFRPANTRALGNLSTTSIRHRAGHRYLAFDARLGSDAAGVGGEGSSNSDSLLKAIAMGYRVIDRFGTHWRLNDGRQVDLLVTLDWKAFYVDLASESWSVFNDDGNYRYARVEPDFSMIIALVIEFGGDDGDHAAPGRGSGVLHVRRFRLENLEHAKGKA